MLRSVCIVALALLGASAGCASAPRSEAAMSTRHVQLLQLEQSMFDALRTRDAQALRRLLSEDFELRMPGQPAVGREAFIASVAAIPGTILEVGSGDTEARVLGEVGVLSGHQRARVKLEDGTEVTQVGAFTDVARWQGGHWVMVHAYNVNVSEEARPPERR
jgi:uncharacterized protein (TIGR02246 family)